MCQISKIAIKYCSSMLKIHLEKVNGGCHCGAHFFGFRQISIICGVCYATAQICSSESDTSVSISPNEICSLSSSADKNIFEGCYN